MSEPAAPRTLAEALPAPDEETCRQLLALMMLTDEEEAND